MTRLPDEKFVSVAAVPPVERTPSTAQSAATTKSAKRSLTAGRGWLLCGWSLMREVRPPPVRRGGDAGLPHIGRSSPLLEGSLAEGPSRCFRLERREISA